MTDAWGPLILAIAVCALGLSLRIWTCNIPDDGRGGGVAIGMSLGLAALSVILVHVASFLVTSEWGTYGR